MHEKYLNRYRISSARASWWDYSNAGAYFITICTRRRTEYFGHIVDGRMHLSPCGVLADVFWYQIPDHSSLVGVGPYVIMPDHVHGIVFLREGAIPSERCTGNAMSEMSPQANSISSVIRGYKSAVTLHTHRLGYEFVWQPRFYDRIIRDDDEYQRIEAYIESNVASWDGNVNHDRDDGFAPQL